jgi:acetyltransferase-like isoleucine patch superfamily enzyme
MLINFRNRIFHKLAFVLPGGYNIRPRLHRLRGAKIGQNVWISQYVYIDENHPEAVTFGDNCTIGLRTSIFTHFYWGPRKSVNGCKEVVIEKNVFIGPHCLIFPGVNVGEGSVVRGGSVLTQNVPSHTFWGPPGAGPLGRVMIPLTHSSSYDEFIRGLKPMRRS